jgi:D-arabinose 1-dehydrogenase-like Zn-dependent alcohol dehydrogenase
VTGIHLDGALAQFVKVNPRNLISLPAGILFEQGCLATDAVATPYHALKARAKLQPAESIAIFGIGGLGSHAVRLARLMGAAPIVAVDISEAALHRAEQAGADLIIDARRQDPAATIRSLVGDLGVDLALDCVGHEQTVLWAAQAVGVGGRVVVVGLGPQRLQALAIAEFVRNEVSVMGSYAFELKEIAEVLSLVDSGRLDLSPSVTKTISLEQINEGLNELSESSGSFIRIVVTRF